jgi:uncharacterized protein (TIGR03437 family)
LELALSRTAASLAAVGYTGPGFPLPVVPGQVVTLFFYGVAPFADGQLRSDQATNVPLPTTLDGLSVHIAQQPLSFPIFAVRQQNECDQDQAGNLACLLTSIRVQVPIELLATTEIILNVDGQPSRGFAVQPIADNSHVLTSCDVSWDTHYTTPCSRLLFHSDGSAVSQSDPARRGETIIVYAFGLGQTSPRVPNGEAAPSGAIFKDIAGHPRVRARFLSFLSTTLTAFPRAFSQEDADDPGSPIAFAGLTPGQVGLYQLNIPIPQTLQPQTPCNKDVLGNTSLHITTSQGTESIPFCVQP